MKVVLLVVLLAMSVLTGCESTGRALTKMYGVQVDPFPGACAPAESFNKGVCVPVAKDVKP